MRFLKIILVIVLALLLVGLGLYWYSGGFAPVKIEERTVGPYQLVLADHYGPYQEVSNIQDSIYEALLAEGVKTKRGFGVYYDDPKEVPEDSLYSIAGCILETPDSNKVKELLRKDFRIEKMGETPSIAVKFPFKNAFSILIAVKRIYPKMEAYRKRHGLAKKPYMEIYDEDSMLITMEKAKK